MFIIPLNTLHLDIPFVNKKIFYKEVSLKPSHVALDNTFIDDFYLNELYENKHILLYPLYFDKIIFFAIIFSS